MAQEENKNTTAANEPEVTAPQQEPKASPDAAGAQDKSTDTTPETETAAGDKKAKKKKNHDTEEIEKLTAEKQQMQEQYLRLMAEYDNYRKRTQKEREGIYPEAVANTIKELLPLIDNFNRALESPCTDESYAKGIQMIAKSLEEFLQKTGVEAFGKEGEPFDPNLHNAVMHVDDDKLGKNVVAQVFQNGYRMGDRILRHAMVQQAN